MSAVTANGIKIEYEEMGPKDGPVILLVMGLAAQMTLWPQPLLKAFTDAGFRVVRFDNRDIGLTEKFHGRRVVHPMLQIAAKVIGVSNLAPYTLHDMVADAIGLLDALKIKKAHVVGASMGGMIAQLMAGTHPERVASLTSIMSGTNNPRLPRPSRETLSLLLAGGSPRGGASKEEILNRMIKVWDVIGTPESGADKAEFRKTLDAAVTRSYYPAGVRRQLAAIIATGDLRPYIRKIAAPTLVIHGSKDPLALVEAGIDSARNIKGARLEVIDGMGHDLPVKFLPRIGELIIAHARSAQATAAQSVAA
jgi:pimeloyl-ACP methyl ester carboxylesterase